MRSAFLSYSRKDRYFVTLLLGVLRYYHIDLWHDSEGVELGSKFPDEIGEGLSTADCLLVVVSANAIGSSWIVREIASFHTEKPNAQIIPLLLQSVKLNELFEGLQDYQAVLFYEDMNMGFEQLLAFFGEQFLVPIERRGGEDRRKSDRRSAVDQRKASTSERLRRGMWKSYTSSTGHGGTDLFGGLRDVGKLAEVLTDEAGGELRRYEFRHQKSGEIHEMTRHLVQDLAYRAMTEMEESETLKHAWVVDRLSRILTELYSVRPLDRRKSDRRSGTERRMP